MRYYTLQPTDVNRALIVCFGRTWQVSSFMGRIMKQDVGKRVYHVGGVWDGILQVENQEQFEARTAQGK